MVSRNQARACTPSEHGRSFLTDSMGPQLVAFLEDPDVAEIDLNPDGGVWIVRLSRGREYAGPLISARQAERLIRIVSSSVAAETHADSPIVSAELPGYGSRFEGLLPPVVAQPVFSIRQHCSVVLSLQDYIEQGCLARDQADQLRDAVQARKNILISGGTFSGKTTFANALLREMADIDDRVVILEDTTELQCQVRDCVRLRTKAGVADMRRLVQSTLRLNPDRIIIGEVRDGSALELLKAWSTGHPGGVATLHASSARNAFTRLEMLIQEVVEVVPHALVGEAIDVIVHIDYHNASNTRRIREILTVDGYADGRYLVQ